MKAAAVVVIGALLIVAYYYFYGSNGQSVVACGCGNPVCPCAQSVQGNTLIDCNCSITNDPCSWPTGDRIWLICHAIAMAEGANLAGRVPDTNNNPGDISDGASTYGSVNADGSNVTTFPNKSTGWQWLYNKVSNIVNGKSAAYPKSATWAQVAKTWAGNSCAWLNNVTSILGVSENSTPADYINE